MAKKKANRQTKTGKLPTHSRSKYSKALAKKIADMYESGEYSVRELCKAAQITPTTFYEWVKRKPYLVERFKQLQAARVKNIGDNAERGIKKLTEGGVFDEVTVEYENVLMKEYNSEGQVIREYWQEIEKKRTVKKKIYMPNVTACIFGATNAFPDRYKHQAHIDHTTKGDKVGQIEDLREVSTEELIERAKAAQGIIGQQAEN